MDSSFPLIPFFPCVFFLAFPIFLESEFFFLCFELRPGLVDSDFEDVECSPDFRDVDDIDLRLRWSRLCRRRRRSSSPLVWSRRRCFLSDAEERRDEDFLTLADDVDGDVAGDDRELLGFLFPQDFRAATVIRHIIKLITLMRFIESHVWKIGNLQWIDFRIEVKTFEKHTGRLAVDPKQTPTEMLEMDWSHSPQTIIRKLLYGKS